MQWKKSFSFVPSRSSYSGSALISNKVLQRFTEANSGPLGISPLFEKLWTLSPIWLYCKDNNKRLILVREHCRLSAAVCFITTSIRDLHFYSLFLLWVTFWKVISNKWSCGCGPTQCSLLLDSSVVLCLGMIKVSWTEFHSYIVHSSFYSTCIHKLADGNLLIKT